MELWKKSLYNQIKQKSSQPADLEDGTSEIPPAINIPTPQCELSESFFSEEAK